MPDVVPAPPLIRSATRADAPALTEIYNHYVLETTVTFEETPVSADTMRTRVQGVTEASLPWLVLEADGALLGYAYATQWRERSAYRFSAESTVYLRHDAGGRGYGTALYDALLTALASRGVHAVMGGIVLPNAASVALHEKVGMRQVAHFREVGYKFGRWLDVGYWQRVLAWGEGAV
jgi:L-amino acid N-acyltransferase YncA